MPFIVYLALGGVCFSMLVSLCLVLRHSTREKSAYEKWIEDIRKENVVKSRRTFSKV